MRVLINLLALVLLSAGAAAHGADDLTGTWSAEVDYGPKLRGQLVITKSSAGYSASIGNEHAKSSGPNLHFNFGHEGSFRGTVHGPMIDGFWVQPGRDASADGDPGGAAQPFATPVELHQTGTGAWRGDVIPVRDRFTLWLSIFKADDGALTAAFRNPQLNSTGGAARFQLSRNADALTFSAKAGDRAISYPAVLLSNPDRIRIEWKDAGGALELTRRSGAAAAAFYPRPPGAPSYVYRPPSQLADGWRTADASKAGIDDHALEGIVRDIAASDPTIRGPRLIHSVLVAHGGTLVLEEYFYGFDRLTPHDTRSAAKTFASVLLGTAPARAAGLTPGTRIYEVMRGLGPFANPDPRKFGITLTHLMTHTSGLSCNDNDDASPGNESTMQGQRAEPDWWRYTLNLPQAFDPGTRYAYCSANMNLVGGALTVGTHTWLPQLFRKTIAEPMQFGEWHWNLMPSGEGYLGGGAFLLPRDFLKIGQMVLDRGMWNGRRILPADWIAQSTRAHVEVTPQTTGLSDEEFGNFYIRGADGLAWHLGSVNSGSRAYRTVSAVGNGGQLLIIVPEADLVVLFTGGNYSQGGVWLRWPQQIVGDKIIPALRP